MIAHRDELLEPVALFAVAGAEEQLLRDRNGLLPLGFIGTLLFGALQVDHGGEMFQVRVLDSGGCRCDGGRDYLQRHRRGNR